MLLAAGILGIYSRLPRTDFQHCCSWITRLWDAERAADHAAKRHTGRAAKQHTDRAAKRHTGRAAKRHTDRARR